LSTAASDEDKAYCLPQITEEISLSSWQRHTISCTFIWRRL